LSTAPLTPNFPLYLPLPLATLPFSSPWPCTNLVDFKRFSDCHVGARCTFNATPWLSQRSKINKIEIEILLVFSGSVVNVVLTHRSQLLPQFAAISALLLLLLLSCMCGRSTKEGMEARKTELKGATHSGEKIDKNNTLN